MLFHKSKIGNYDYGNIEAGYYFQAMIAGSPVQRFWHQNKFDVIVDCVPERSRVLDIGCGPGSFLYVLGSRLLEVEAVGVDIASEQIKFANGEIASRFPDGRLRFVALDPNIVALPFKDESFDVITIIEVIEHIHPHLAYRMIEEAKRLLKKDGKLIVTTPNYRSPWPLVESALNLLSPVKYNEQHVSKFTPSASVKFLETAGFRLSSLETIFFIAPFLACISKRLAQWCKSLEKKLNWKLGCLLILIAGRDLELEKHVKESPKLADTETTKTLPKQETMLIQ